MKPNKFHRNDIYHSATKEVNLFRSVCCGWGVNRCIAYPQGLTTFVTTTICSVVKVKYDQGCFRPGQPSEKVTEQVEVV